MDRSSRSSRMGVAQSGSLGFLTMVTSPSLTIVPFHLAWGAAVRAAAKRTASPRPMIRAIGRKSVIRRLLPAASSGSFSFLHDPVLVDRDAALAVDEEEVVAGDADDVGEVRE